MTNNNGYVIWKYKLEITDSQTIRAPQTNGYYSFLDVQFQRGNLCLWVMVQPGAEEEEIEVRIIGTGHPISAEEEKDLCYIGTVVDERYGLVWHVFEVMKKQEWGEE